MKERNHFPIRRLLGPVVSAAVEFLQVRGELGERIDAPVLVPAPTLAVSARLRGGDPVTDLCVASGLPVVSALRHRRGVRDQVGLDPTQRRRNLAGKVELLAVPREPVLLVDDVVTTGSTLAASAEVLIAAGCRVVGAVVLAHA
ncbi:ComF family protein [Corynebacterium alimapuense]|nr:phosphoribosyltransferase family protein [Corynebacterium alimapuense]